MKNILGHLRSDWKVATKYEKARFIIVLSLIIGLGAVSIWLISFTLGSDFVATDGTRKILLSFSAFIGMLVLSKVKLTPKGRNKEDK